MRSWSTEREKFRQDCANLGRKRKKGKKDCLGFGEGCRKSQDWGCDKISRRNQKKYVDLAKCTANVKKDQDYHHKAPLPTEVGSWQDALDTIGESQS